jgi:hypothetical protein
MGAMGVTGGGYAYIIGGCSAYSSGACTTLNNTAQTFKIYNNSSGSPAAWSPSGVSMGTNRAYHGAVVLNGFLYVAGGCSGVSGFGVSGCAISTGTVEMAAIGADGTLSGNGSGAWCGSGGGGSCPTITNLPSTSAGGGSMVAVGGSLYFIGGKGGLGGAAQSSVFYATPNASTGAITSWGTASNGLPLARSDGSATVWNNRIYYAGGNNGGTGCNGVGSCQSVFISPTLSSGGDITSAWTTSSASLPVYKSRLALVAYANNLYAIGGDDGNAAVGGLNYSDVEYAPIDVSGGAASTSGDSLGSWSYTTPLPHGILATSAFAANGYLYIMGGAKDGSGATQCSNTTLMAPISSNTSTGTPTGTGNWVEPGSFYQSTVGTTSGSWGSGITYYNGKVYITGGACNNAFVVTSGGSGNKNTQQSTLLSQPQVAKYSLSFDTDTNVYPRSFLFNGTDNSIGARWQLKYRTMSDPGAVTNLGTGIDCSTSVMSGWGQVTSVSSLTLGSLGTYTPLDASGANMSCGRYYTLNVSVDAQNSFGYPDDTSRGPTISDISLRYTAAPSKRSLHGRTFINGLQTPLDTPKYTN